MKRTSCNWNCFPYSPPIFTVIFYISSSVMPNICNVGRLEFSLNATCIYKPLWWKKEQIQERGNNNYLSLMPHRSMCKSLKFPREPCWTKMRSLGWLSIKMSLIQPWKAVMGFKHWESVKLSGHPVGKREKVEKNIGMFIYFCWDFLVQELRRPLFQVFSFLMLQNLLCYKSSSKENK